MCEWWRLLQCAAWSRPIRRRMANRWGQCLFAITFDYSWFLFGQESLPIFQILAELSKFLEGENYVLSSTYWGALFDVEEVLAHHAAYSAHIAALRQAMHDDHFNKRVTLEKSLSNVLLVLMTLLDPRYTDILFVLFFCHTSCALIVDGVCIVLWNWQRINGT